MFREIISMAKNITDMFSKESINANIFDLHNTKNVSSSNKIINTSFSRSNKNISSDNSLVKTSFDFIERKA